MHVIVCLCVLGGIQLMQLFWAECNQKSFASSVPLLLLTIFILLNSIAMLIAFLSSTTFFHTKYSLELMHCMLPLLTWSHYISLSTDAHPHSVQSPRARANQYLDMYIHPLHTYTLEWNSLLWASTSRMQSDSLVSGMMVGQCTGHCFGLAAHPFDKVDDDDVQEQGAWEIRGRPPRYRHSAKCWCCFWCNSWDAPITSNGPNKRMWSHPIKSSHSHCQVNRGQQVYRELLHHQHQTTQPRINTSSSGTFLVKVIRQFCEHNYSFLLDADVLWKNLTFVFIRSQ